MGKKQIKIKTASKSKRDQAYYGEAEKLLNPDRLGNFGRVILNMIGLVLISVALRHEEFLEAINLFAASDKSSKTFEGRFDLKEPMNPLMYFLAFSSAAIGGVFIVHCFSYRFTFIIACGACFFGQLMSLIMVFPKRTSVFLFHVTVGGGNAAMFALPYFRIWEFLPTRMKVFYAGILYIGISYLSDEIAPYFWIRFLMGGNPKK